VTNRQSQRLFLEYFARRLLLTHGQADEFACEAHPASTRFAECVRDTIGHDGGVVPGALHHGCIECTHKKRYRSDLEQEGAELHAGNEAEVAGLEEVVNGVSEVFLSRAFRVIDHLVAGCPCGRSEPFTCEHASDAHTTECTSTQSAMWICTNGSHGWENHRTSSEFRMQGSMFHLN